LSRADWRFAKSWWHWFFFVQSEKAEAAILVHPNLWYPEEGASGSENNRDHRNVLCPAVYPCRDWPQGSAAMPTVAGISLSYSYQYT
jgi:hypothetical protein